MAGACRGPQAAPATTLSYQLAGLHLAPSLPQQERPQLHGVPWPGSQAAGGPGPAAGQSFAAPDRPQQGGLAPGAPLPRAVPEEPAAGCAAAATAADGSGELGSFNSMCYLCHKNPPGARLARSCLAGHACWPSTAWGSRSLRQQTYGLSLVWQPRLGYGPQCAPPHARSLGTKHSVPPPPSPARAACSEHVDPLRPLRRLPQLPLRHAHQQREAGGKHAGSHFLQGSLSRAADAAAPLQERLAQVAPSMSRESGLARITSRGCLCGCLCCRPSPAAGSAASWPVATCASSAERAAS